MWLQTEQPTRTTQVFIVVSIILIATSGVLVLLKFPKSIIKLRQYIEEIATGILPDEIKLFNADNSDDLRFIELGLNAILREMRNRMELMEQELEVEHRLRKTIERQQQNLLKAERHHAMIQSLGAACHHIGQPATILKMRLRLVKEIVSSDAELAEIEECEKDLRLILIVLDKLRAVNEFKTEPYINDKDCDDSEILAI